MQVEWESLPSPKLQRVEMWCARQWAEAKEVGLAALAKGSVREYGRARQDEQEWFAALLVVNRISLGIEPLEGAKFIQEAKR